MNEFVEVLIANTWACNLRCKYCFVQANHVGKMESDMTATQAVMTMDALDESLGDFASAICLHFYGGEPLLNLDAIEAMVNHAATKKKGRFTFAITTNGTVLADKVFELLAKGKFSIILSIDGPQHIHDECRVKANGKPCHVDVLTFLEKVRTLTSCHVTGSAVVRSGWRLRDATAYIRSLNVHAIKSQAIRAPIGSPYALTAEEREVYMQDLEGVGQGVIADLEAGRFPMDVRYNSRVLGLLTNHKRENFCTSGFSTFGISPSGNVYPCILVTDSEAALGHISDNPPTWLEKGRQWRNAPKRPECPSCPTFDRCGGGCPAIIPVCGEDECEIVRKNDEIATMIFDHFKDKKEDLLGLAGIF